MPDEKDNELTDDEEVPETPLHAYGDDREDEVVGDDDPEVGDEGDLDEKGNPVGDDE